MKRLNNLSNRFLKRAVSLRELVAVVGLMLLSHSGALAQWLQSSGNNQALNLQFANSGFVSIGAAAPTTYVSPYRFEVFGTTRFAGNSLIDNGNLTLSNGNLSVTGNMTLLPNGGVAPFLRLTNAGNTFSTTFQSVATANVTYNLPPTDGAAGQVLSTNGAGALSWAAAGGIGGGGAPPFIPLWVAVNTLGNSILQQNLGNVWVGPQGGLPPVPVADLLQINGTARVGDVWAGPVIPVAPTAGSTLTFSGVPGTFGPIPTVDGDNTDIVQQYRINMGPDITQFRLNIGDNPQGLPLALPGPPPFPNLLPDYFTIGATNAGAWYQMHSFSTNGQAAIGYNVAHVNGLDVGFNPVPGGTVPGLSGNAAIGTAYGGLIAAPVDGLIVQGMTGIGTAAPGNQLEVDLGTGVGATSGLRLTQFAAGSIPGAGNGRTLSVNAAGDVILVNAGGSLTGSGSSPRLAVWTGGTSLGNSILYEDNSNIRLGINVASPSSTLSLNFNSGASQQTIGVERTTTANEAGTPLTITSGAGDAGSSNMNGGDLTLSGGMSTGSGGSNILFKVATPGSSGSTDRTPGTQMYLKGDGKLGLGTTTPSYSVSLDGESPKTISLESNTSTSGQSLTVRGGDAKASGTNNLAGGNLVLVAGNSVGTGSSKISFQTPTPGASGNSYNTISEKMVILGNGNVGIGQAAPGQALDVLGNINVSGTGAGNITITGTGTATGGWNVSDARFKVNVANLTNALTKVMALHPVEYDFRHSEFPDWSFPKGHQIGFIAQEMEQVIPEVVNTGKNGFMGIAYQNLTALLAQAIKEQQAQIAQKDAELAAATASIANLTARLERLEVLVGAMVTPTTPAPTTTLLDAVTYYQNDPNPFSVSTTVHFDIPQEVQQASLLIINGVTSQHVLHLPIASRGKGQVEVSASKLQPGQYLYTIIVDEVQLPAKLMTVIK